MRASSKVILNTGILYAKILISMFISLWTVPLVLRALGESDYGLYNLIAGVVALLSFVNGAMTVSTQRYLSITIGKGDNEQINKIYNVSICLHLTMAIIIILIFELFSPVLFNGSILNIPTERIPVAQQLFQLLIVGLFFTILSVPFDAVLNANENMLVFSLISICDSIFKLLLAYSLTFIHTDTLLFYGIGIAVITSLITVIKYSYVAFRYRNLRISIKRYFDFKLYKEMFSFAGWNTFGAMAGVGRIQGIAIILNTFFGTVINAAYGIANQVNGVLNYFTVTLQKSINPQLMSSEGQGNHARMIRISHLSSKYSVLLISMLALPVIVDAPYILQLWLHDVPEYTVVFVRLILIMSIINQFSVGIMSALQSVGNIRTYQIVVGSLVLLNLPISYAVLKLGYPPSFVFASAVVIDIVALIARLIIVNKQVIDFNVRLFCKSILFPITLLILINILILHIESIWMTSSLIRLICVCLSSVIITGGAAWFCMMQQSEKDMIINFIRRR